MELENVDPLTSGVFQAFSKTLHLQRQAMMKLLAEKGVHPGEPLCLHLLTKRDGTSQLDLADDVHLSRPRVTKIVQTLEKEGAVVRRADESDQRLTRVFLTSEGRRRAMDMHALMQRYVERIIAPFSAADRVELERLLSLLADGISRVLNEEEEPSR